MLSTPLNDWVDLEAFLAHYNIFHRLAGRLLHVLNPLLIQKFHIAKQFGDRQERVDSNHSTQTCITPIKAFHLLNRKFVTSFAQRRY